MKSTANDPDNIQIKDELDPEWVNLWHTTTTKKEPTTVQLTFDCIIPEKRKP